MKSKYLFLIFVCIVLISPVFLPTYQVTLLSYIGLNALVVLGLVLVTGVGLSLPCVLRYWLVV